MNESIERVEPYYDPETGLFDGEWEECGHCDGTGTEPGRDVVDCDACKGRGLL